MAEKYDYISFLQSYDDTYPMSKIVLSQKLMEQVRADYSKLLKSSNNNPLMVIENADKFMDAMNDSKLKENVPGFLKSKEVVNFERIAMVKRFAMVKLMVSKIENEISNEFQKDKFAFDFSKNLTFSNNSSLGVTIDSENLDGKSGHHYMDIDVGNIFAFPALETYAIIKGRVHNAIYKHKSKSEKNAVSTDDLDLNNDTAKSAIDKDREKAVSIIKTYLTSFIKSNFGEYFSDVENISEMVASEIVDSIIKTKTLQGSQCELKDILDPFFDLKSIDNVASNSVEDFINTFGDDGIVSARVAKLHFLADNATEAKQVNYMQMAGKLLESNATYKVAKASGMFSETADFASIPEDKLREMCESFAETFMNAHGLKTINFTFKKEGGEGTYQDSSDPTQIEININTEKIKSVSELYMTLSHELTHASDSAINKINNKFNENHGGLLNDISEDISASVGDKVGYPIVKKLNRYCYLINPNERNARVAELSGLIYAKTVNNMTDANGKKIHHSDAIEKSIEISVQKYIAYQKKTMNAISEIKGYLNTLTIPANISPASKRLIDQRVNYLKGLLNDKELDILNTKDEEKSIEDAQKILDPNYSYQKHAEKEQSDMNEKEAQRLAEEAKKQKENKNEVDNLEREF